MEMPERGGAIDESALRQYVMGLSDERQRSAIEDQVFVSDDLLQQLEAVEAEVVDEYVAGELTPEEGASLERRSQENERLRAQIALARSLRAAAGRIAAIRTRRPASTWSWLPLAAAFVVVITGLLLVLLTSRGGPRGGDSTIPASGVATGPPPAAPAPSPLPGVPAAPSRAVVAIVTLTGSTLRSAREVVEVPRPEQDGELELRLVVEPGDEYPAYEAELSSATNQLVWKPPDLVYERTSEGIGAVVVRVPNARLDQGPYELLLRGRPRQGRPQELGVYRFRIVNP